MAEIKKSWLEILRMALSLGRAIREKTQRECPNTNCPLKLNKIKPTQDDLIKHHEEMYEKNHGKR